ncbi:MULTISPECIES: ATP-dependent helicase HrpB [Brevibacillus]|uniref:ATP-dependent helicase HrpB n=1 Tax=Brevibacillus TaxID=55080 RepID=UPI000D10C9D7|nr:MULTISPECIES: ATP-dependent helicase HrpB [Brevibacillus]MED1948302.1 ATP-dependent helicase HrpB [Brevibacillus formosus]MED1997967.1 ATP-dependent helicase HrpB [Brevibacillus formosus]MED2080508.1 ATP-dependent helicase HrpB [Brevibacillus formosus]PSK21149.1 ATP-dependent helicase HrpB [Brevibacillus sp. NRRL NRS-603]
MNALPINEVLPELVNTLRKETNAVLVAAPGAGKTTRVPLALRDEAWLHNRRIVMLVPRRLAARQAAAYMAALLGEEVGQTVGYRVKRESRVGPGTRIEVITEGILTRMLQDDPELSNVGLVIFDEFHERNLHADLGLALSLQAQGLFREDLRILVMSATLDAEPVSALLGNAPVISSKGRMFPVETHFLTSPMEGRLEEAVVQMIFHALRQEEGDMLVFLPGAKEIHRVQELLEQSGVGSNIRIAPLYGNLPQEEQDKAILPGKTGERKIVLATTIAETSLTVEGVRIVIDSGLKRVPRFSPRTGMTRLETAKVSKASADQRRGRAGRLAPGVCFRLWTEQEDRMLVPQQAPEIMEADLAVLALELALWGVGAPEELDWLNPPPKPAMAQAQELLLQLGAFDERKQITPHGRVLAGMGVHPRLGHMIQKANELGEGELACELAVLLEERDIVRGRQASADADMRTRVEMLRQVANKQSGAGELPIDAGACKRLWKEAAHFKRIWINNKPGDTSARTEATGRLLAFAYPDRIAQRRADGRYLLRNGRGAAFSVQQPLAASPYIVAAELDDQGADSRILLAASVEESELLNDCAMQITERMNVWWEHTAGAVRSRKQKRLGSILLADIAAEASPDEVLTALLDGIKEEGLEILPWNRQARQYRERLLFMHRLEEGWPNVADEALLVSLEEWLGPHVYGFKKKEDLQSLAVTTLLEGMLSWEQRRQLDEYAPTHVIVPSGSKIPVDYSDSAAPVLSVRLQELFGWQDSPRIGRGRVPLTLHLLSPAHRPVQVTRDLASFWAHAYFEVKKDLKGRYPKHYWPDDPLAAIPTNRTRPRL